MILSVIFMCACVVVLFLFLLLLLVLGRHLFMLRTGHLSKDSSRRKGECR
jgi:hypothetical protein